MPWEKCEGLGWARSRIQRLYAGEEYTLQLDSHHRFAEGWDERLIEACELTGSPKPLLTSYAGMYDPKSNKKLNSEPYKMVADRFTSSGTILFRPHVIPHWDELTKPIPARFVSGHYFFTLGRHCEEYAYDPNIYFAGDEISLSIRSFTLGYDLFHPHRTWVWHEYTREGRVKHWDDHVADNREAVGRLWHERDTASKRRLRQLLKEEENDEDLGIYGLGAVRTHAEYERYAGINFANRKLHPEATAGGNPPCSATNDSWAERSTTSYELKLKWAPSELDLCDDLHFVYIGLEDVNGNVVFRHDAPGGSPIAMGAVCDLTAKFCAESSPERMVIWPVSKSRGWLQKRVYLISEAGVGLNGGTSDAAGTPSSLTSRS